MKQQCTGPHNSHQDGLDSDNPNIRNEEERDDVTAKHISLESNPENQSDSVESIMSPILYRTQSLVATSMQPFLNKDIPVAVVSPTKLAEGEGKSLIAIEESVVKNSKPESSASDESSEDVSSIAEIDDDVLEQIQALFQRKSRLSVNDILRAFDRSTIRGLLELNEKAYSSKSNDRALGRSLADILNRQNQRCSARIASQLTMEPDPVLKTVMESHSNRNSNKNYSPSVTSSIVGSSHSPSDSSTSQCVFSSRTVSPSAVPPQTGIHSQHDLYSSQQISFTQKPIKSNLFSPLRQPEENRHKLLPLDREQLLFSTLVNEVFGDCSLQEHPHMTKASINLFPNDSPIWDDEVDERNLDEVLEYNITHAEHNAAEQQFQKAVMQPALAALVDDGLMQPEGSIAPSIVATHQIMESLDQTEVEDTPRKKRGRPRKIVQNVPNQRPRSNETIVIDGKEGNHSLSYPPFSSTITMMETIPPVTVLNSHREELWLKHTDEYLYELLNANCSFKNEEFVKLRQESDAIPDPRPTSTTQWNQCGLTLTNPINDQQWINDEGDEVLGELILHDEQALWTKLLEVVETESSSFSVSIPIDCSSIISSNTGRFQRRDDL